MSVQAKPHGQISHSADKKQIDIALIEDRIRQSKDLALSVDETIQMLHELTEFELGQFLLETQGLNAFWTSYVIQKGDGRKQTPAETWILEQAPLARATQERFGIFQEQVKKYLMPHMHLASVPCGVMDDLLTLDYADIEGIQLTGIDLDAEAIQLAKASAEGIAAECQFETEDAWQMRHSNKFDLLLSNGLTVYEQDDDQVIALYEKFYDSLKAGGRLITSFTTPSPAETDHCTWEITDIEAIKKQKAYLSDIIQSKWNAFRTAEKTTNMLKAAGFDQIDIIEDSQRMFPTVVAQKSAH